NRQVPGPRLSPVWVVGLGGCVVLGAQDAEQAVLLVVEAGGEPQRGGAAVGRGAGQQAPQAGLGERLAGGGVPDQAGDPVREVMALLGQNVDPAVTEVTDQQRAGRVTPAGRRDRQAP